MSFYPRTDYVNPPEDPECDYCGRTGHTFRSCPKRDDVVDYGDAEPTEEQVNDWNIANDHQDRGEEEA